MAHELKDIYTELIKKAALNAMDVVMSMNVPVHAIKAPIANDYVKYNEYANHGELVDARLWLINWFYVWLIVWLFLTFLF